MTNINLELPEKECDKHKQRTSSFYNQTVAENNARINAKMAGQTAAQQIAALTDEIKFIQADLLTRGLRTG